MTLLASSRRPGGAFQDGGMYDFNGNFIYAVVYLLYLVLALYGALA
jgi:hypothetical protein